MNRFACRLAAGFVCLLAGTAFAGDPVVSNVRASQRGGGSKLVDIYYDVADSDGDRLTVSAVITDNGAPVPATSLTGAIGANVAPGAGKQIVWDAGADWSGQFSQSVRVAITADDGQTPVPSGMVLIPAGINSGTDPDFGAYSLTNPMAFYMDATEVTKAKWDEVYIWAISHGYTFAHAGSGKAANHPVHTVSWHDCVKWCNARSEKEGRPVSYRVSGSVYRGTDDNAVVCDTSAAGYRLPTDVEFEYAARGGLSGKRYPWGDDIDHTKANYWGETRFSSGGFPYTSPVTTFAANGYGLYDMAGNLFEWCSDWYPGYVGSIRVDRGGSWNYGADSCRPAYRSNRLAPDYAWNIIGFRAALPLGQ